MAKAMAAIPIIHYRAKQFFAALNPKISANDRQLVKSVFGKNRQALVLFQQMNMADQQHAIAILRTLLEGGENHLALLQAALLHDVGKAMGQPLLHRVIIVLLKVFWPTGLNKLSQSSLACASWRKPFVVNAQHPQIGASWAEAAGCSHLTVALINNHQNEPSSAPKTPLEKLHRVLYEADGEN